MSNRCRSDVTCTNPQCKFGHSQPFCLNPANCTNSTCVSRHSVPACTHFSSPTGCNKGANCKFRHVAPLQAAQAAPAPAVAQACRYADNCTNRECGGHEKPPCPDWTSCTRQGCNSRHLPPCMRANCPRAGCRFRHQPPPVAGAAAPGPAAPTSAANPSPAPNSPPQATKCKSDVACFFQECPFLHSVGPCPTPETCNRASCRFRHFTNCEFGEGCRKFSCKFSHPPARPKRCPHGAECPNLGGDCGLLHPNLSRLEVALLRSLRTAGLAQKQLRDLEKRLHDVGAKHDKRRAEAQTTAHRELRHATLPDEARNRDAVLEEIDKQLSECCTLVRSLLNGQTADRVWRIKAELARLEAALPVLAKRSEILEHAHKSPFLVVRGETGSGKSTQLPQYFAQSLASGTRKVFVTQPRKIAATSLAERVALEVVGGVERFAKVPGFVGYHVGGAKKIAPQTRIVFMTEGTLLQQLLSDKFNPAECGVLIIDEVHERNVATDLLLGVFKTNITTKPEWRHIKLVATSATLDVKQLSTFLNHCPAVEIAGRTYPVNVLYAPMGAEESHVNAVIAKALELHLQQPIGAGDILCFLTAQDEVEKARLVFEAQIKEGMPAAKVLSAYGKQSPEEQKELFRPTPKGIRKVIFATDVAETSITIDGVRFVVDCGLTKDNIYDPSKNLTALKIVKISRSSAEQRKGRAGRTSSGTCIRLYSQPDFEQLEAQSAPALLRSSMSLTTVTVLALRMDPNTFEWLTKPDPAALANALWELKLYEAIEKDSLKLTEFGRFVGHLQLDPPLAKIMWTGSTAGLAEAAATLCGLFSVASMFFWRGGDAATESEADAAKKGFSNPAGDLVSMYGAFQAWLEIIRSRPAKMAESAPDGPTLQDFLAAGFNSSILQKPLVEAEASDASSDSYSFHSAQSESVARSTASTDDVGNTDDFVGIPEAQDAFADADDDLERKANHLVELATQGRPAGDSTDGRVVSSLRNWARTNFINQKALTVAMSIKNDLLRLVRQFDGRFAPSAAPKIPSETELRCLLISGFFSNLAILEDIHKRPTYKTVRTGVYALIHPGSVVSPKQTGSQQLPRFVVFQTLLRTSQTWLTQVTPVPEEWLRGQVPVIWQRGPLIPADFNSVLASAANSIMKDFVLSPINPTLIRKLCGKRGEDRLQHLEKALDCTIQIEDVGLRVICRNPELVEEQLKSRIQALRTELLKETMEVTVANSTRLLVGTGCVAEQALLQDDFISVNIQQLPALTTDQQVLEWLGKKGIPKQSVRSCAVSTAGTGVADHAWAYVMLDSIETAKRVAALKGETFSSGAILSITPAGVRTASAFTDNSARLVVSWAIAPHDGKARLIFRSEADRDASLQLFQKPDIQARLSASPIQALVVIRDVPTEKSGLKRSLTLKGLHPSIDEHDFLELFRARGFKCFPSAIMIHRLPQPPTDTDEPLSVQIAEIRTHVSVVESNDNWVGSIDEKLQRGFLHGFFSSSELCNRAQQLVLQSQLPKSFKFEQPLRISAEYSCTISIHSDLWTALKGPLSEEMSKLRTQGVEAKAQRQGTDNRSVIAITATDLHVLHGARNCISKVIQPELFEHAKKTVLFSCTGRDMMEALSRRSVAVFLNWDNSTRQLRVFGATQELRDGMKARLTEIIEQLTKPGIEVDKLINLVPRKDRSPCDAEVARFKKLPGVIHLVQRGLSLQVTGTSEAIARIQESAFVLKKSKKSSGAECMICYGACQDRVTLLACSACSFCRECVEPVFQPTTSSVPLKCPMCSTPIALSDIVALGAASFGAFSEMAASEFVQRSKLFMRCPNAGRGCQELLRKPAAGEKNVVCSGCSVSFCLVCTELADKRNEPPVESHPAAIPCGQSIATVQKIDQHCTYIAENILTLKCPRCKQAFIDFEGCLALKCNNSSCAAAFCAICLEDCGKDAHEHVITKCNRGNYFLSPSEYAARQNERKLRLILEYLNQNVEPQLHEQVRNDPRSRVC